MPRPRRSREQWCDLVSEWRDSGWSGVDFARNRGLNPNTFAWWRSELSRSARPTPLTLVPVRATPNGVPENHPSVEVVVYGGVTVRVSEQADPAWVARLVLALEAR